MLLPLSSIIASLVPALSQKTIYFKLSILKGRCIATCLSHATVNSPENETQPTLNSVQHPYAFHKPSTHSNILQNNALLHCQFIK